MKAILLLLVFFIHFAVNGQQKEHSLFSKHIFYLETGGLNPYFIGYENIVNPENSVKVMFGIAGSFYRATNDNAFLTIKAYNGVLAGKDPFFAGLSLNLVRETFTYRNIHHNYDYGIDIWNENYLVPEFSIRYQPAKRGLYASFAASYTYNDLFSISDYVDEPVFSWQFGQHFVSPSFKLGYTF